LASEGAQPIGKPVCHVQDGIRAHHAGPDAPWSLADLETIEMQCTRTQLKKINTELLFHPAFVIAIPELPSDERSEHRWDGFTGSP